MHAPRIAMMSVALSIVAPQAAPPAVVLPSQKPTDALFKQVLAVRNVSFEADRWEWRFYETGEVKTEWHDESPGVWSTDCSCSGPWASSAATLRFTCEAACTKAYSNFAPRPPKQWHEGKSLSVRFVYVSPQLTLFVHDGKRWLSEPCSPLPPENPRCSRTRETVALLVQLIPGAKDLALFEAVKASFSAKPPPVERLIFEGAPASKPREVTEVLFTAGNEAAARALAGELEPVIGKVEVKP